MNKSCWNWSGEFMEVLHGNACGILLNVFPFPRKGDRNKVLGSSTSLRGEVVVFPKIIRLADDGILQCVARVQNNSNIQPTVSKDHYLKVIGGSLCLQGRILNCRQSPDPVKTAS